MISRAKLGKPISLSIAMQNRQMGVSSRTCKIQIGGKFKDHFDDGKSRNLRTGNHCYFRQPQPHAQEAPGGYLHHHKFLAADV
jgi:hypothetical protein